MSNRLDVVQALLVAGVKVSEYSLHLAVLNNNVELADLLIKNGADAHINTEGGIDVRDRLLPLGIAAACENVAMHDLLVNGGADINANQKNGSSLLYWALDHNLEKFAQQLLDAGADVNQHIDRYRTSLLHWAVQNQFLTIAKLLIENGADLNVPNGGGKTPLCYGIDTGDINFLDQLTKVKRKMITESNMATVTKWINSKFGNSLHYAARWSKPPLQ